MKRTIEPFLDEWRKRTDRKVLLVRGARQVGKTYSVRNLGKAFESYLEVNFEEEKAVCSFFSGSLDPADICKKLSAYFDIPLVPERSLLFLKERNMGMGVRVSLENFRRHGPILTLPLYAVGRLAASNLLGPMPSPPALRGDKEAMEHRLPEAPGDDN
jgi:hypothetical protein